MDGAHFGAASEAQSAAVQVSDVVAVPLNAGGVFDSEFALGVRGVCAQESDAVSVGHCGDRGGDESVPDLHGRGDGRGCAAALFVRQELLLLPQRAGIVVIAVVMSPYPTFTTA